MKIEGFEIVSINFAISMMNADKHEFEKEYKSECCQSKICRGNAMYDLVCEVSGEVHRELCTRCLKEYATLKYNGVILY